MNYFFKFAHTGLKFSEKLKQPWSDYCEETDHKSNAISSINLSFDRFAKHFADIVPSLKTYFDNSIRSQMAFISTDIESDMNDTLDIHGKRVVKLHKKLLSLSSAVSNMRSSAAVHVPSESLTTVDSRPLTVHCYTIAAISIVDSVGKTCTSSSMYDRCQQTTVEMRSVGNLTDNGGHEMCEKDNEQQYVLETISTVKQVISEVEDSFEKVGIQASKLVEVVKNGVKGADDDIKLEGKVNVVKFQVMKLNDKVEGLTKAMNNLKKSLLLSQEQLLTVHT